MSLAGLVTDLKAGGKNLFFFFSVLQHMQKQLLEIVSKRSTTEKQEPEHSGWLHSVFDVSNARKIKKTSYTLHLHVPRSRFWIMLRVRNENG